jgi:hypothetical protein
LAVVGSNTDAPAMVFWAVALAGIATRSPTRKSAFSHQSCATNYVHHRKRPRNPRSR